MGNLLEVDDVGELTQEYDSIQMVLEELKRHGIIDERCKECVVRGFCWTCPGSVETITNINALESQCKEIYPMLMSRVWGEKK